LQGRYVIVKAESIAIEEKHDERSESYLIYPFVR